MNIGLQQTWGARLARRFLRHQRGAISPLFALMLIPIVGVMAMAVEIGNGVFLQRAAQHAADSAALAAATGANLNCYDSAGNKSGTASTSTGLCGTGYTPGYQLESKAVAANFGTSGATVTPIMAYCPGTTSGSLDCYKVTVSRTLNTYLSAIVGITSLTPTATAYARANTNVDLCLVALGSGGITVAGLSTGFDTCYAESLQGQVKCTSTSFQGVFAPSVQACSTFTQIPSSTTNPYTSIASNIPTRAQAPCSTGASTTNLTAASLVWTTVAGTSYARLCDNTFALGAAGDLTIAAAGANKAVILDNATIDTNGHNFTGSGIAGSYGVTIISTNNPPIVSSSTSLQKTFVNNSSGPNKADSAVTIQGPADGTGTFGDYAWLDDDRATTVANVGEFKPPSSPQVNLNITGVLYTPYRDLTFNGAVSSSIGGITCISIVADAINSNGGKLANNPTSGCAGGGYTTLTHTTANVALVK